MDLSQWLDQKRGRATALAQHFGVSHSAVSQWRANGVPRRKMVRLRAYTRGAVALADMIEPLTKPSADVKSDGVDAEMLAGADCSF